MRWYFAVSRPTIAISVSPGKWAVHQALDFVRLAGAWLPGAGKVTGLQPNGAQVRTRQLLIQAIGAQAWNQTSPRCVPPSLGCSWGRSHHIFYIIFLVEDRITGSTSLSIGEPQRVAASSRSGRAIPGPADWQQHFVNKTQLLTDHQPTLVYVHQATTQVRCTISHGCYRWL
jgi:hypothetical protein